MRLFTFKLTTIFFGLALPLTAFAQQPSGAGQGGTQGRVGIMEQRAPAVSANTMQLGARIAYTNVDRLEGGTMGIGASWEYAVAENFLFGLTLDHWRKDAGTIDLYRTVEASDTVFGAHTKMLFTQFNLPVRPFGLIGFTAHRLSVRESKLLTPEEGQPRVDQRLDTFKDTEGEFGIDLGAGVSYPINENVDLNAEMRWRNILEDSVKYDQIALTGGVGYIL